MERHEFRMDTRGVDRHNVSRRVKVLLGISLFLTGFGALGGTMSIVSRIREEAWEEMGAGSLLLECTFCTHSHHQSGGADPDCVRAGRRKGVFQDADRLCMADRGGNNSGFGGDSKAP